jgi:hypothetical protein
VADYLTEEVWQHRWHGLHQAFADVEAVSLYCPTTALPFINVGVAVAAERKQRKSLPAIFEADLECHHVFWVAHPVNVFKEGRSDVATPYIKRGIVKGVGKHEKD